MVIKVETVHWKKGRLRREPSDFQNLRAKHRKWSWQGDSDSRENKEKSGEYNIMEMKGLRSGSKHDGKQCYKDGTWSVLLNAEEWSSRLTSKHIHWLYPEAHFPWVVE